MIRREGPKGDTVTFTHTMAGTITARNDVKGNQTSRPATLSSPALNLECNFDNQLIGADTNGSAGSLKVTFQYNVLGCVSRSHSSGKVVCVRAGQQVIADYARGTAASTPTYRDVYADYVDEPILRHSGPGSPLPGSGDNALFYHRNQQYSIVGLTNAAGTLVERYTYTAYGTLGIYAADGTVRTTSSYDNRYTYTGREWDAELKLYHFRARWYDPATGGFISRDPLGYVDGMSLYRGYFQLVGTDPNGEGLIIPIAVGVGACAYLVGCTAIEHNWNVERGVRAPTAAERKCFDDLYRIMPKQSCSSLLRWNVQTKPGPPHVMCHPGCMKDLTPGGNILYLGPSDLDCSTCASVLNNMLTLLHECVHFGQGCYLNEGYHPCLEYEATQKSVMAMGRDPIGLCDKLVKAKLCKSQNECHALLMGILHNEDRQTFYLECLKFLKMPHIPTETSW